MDLIRVFFFAAGLALVGWTLLSAVRTVVLPRSAQSVLSRAVFRGLSTLFRLLAGEKASFVWRDRVWALFSPLALLPLAATWVVLVEVGFMLMFRAVQDDGWSEAFFLSGSSLLTLGFAPADTFGERVLAFGEATIGLGLVALLIAFLPTLYSNFQRREVKVGEPRPSAAESSQLGETQGGEGNSLRARSAGRRSGRRRLFSV